MARARARTDYNVLKGINKVTPHNKDLAFVERRQHEIFLASCVRVHYNREVKQGLIQYYQNHPHIQRVSPTEIAALLKKERMRGMNGSF